MIYFSSLSAKAFALSICLGKSCCNQPKEGAIEIPHQPKKINFKHSFKFCSHFFFKAFVWKAVLNETKQKTLRKDVLNMAFSNDFTSCFLFKNKHNIVIEMLIIIIIIKKKETILFFQLNATKSFLPQI
jgi:hypothetical protein